MRELEELADENGVERGIESEGEEDGGIGGGNTSEGSGMGVTPADFNEANGRFDSTGNAKDMVQPEAKDPENGKYREYQYQQQIEEDESEYEMSMVNGLPKRRKKKRKTSKAPVPPGGRHLKMAEAYGGSSNDAMIKAIAEKEKREAQKRQSVGASAPRMSKIASRGQMAKNQMSGNMNQGLRLSSAENSIKGFKPPRDRKEATLPVKKTSRDSNRGTAQTSRQKADNFDNKPPMQKTNNFMNKSGSSFNQPSPSRRSGMTSRDKNAQKNQRDEKLNNIANSVTGFYKQPTNNSQMDHESNMAHVNGPR
jgi:hypothetical protein